MNLRGLDEKLLPAMARGLARLLGRARLAQTPAPPARPDLVDNDVRGTPARRVAPRTSLSTATARLLALDDRWARRGLLGHLRAVPQSAAALIVALLLAGSLAAVHLAGRHRAAPTVPADTTVAASLPASCPVGTAAGSAYVGPALAASLPGYVTAQATTVARCARATPGARLYAVVSLTVAETPMQAAEALRGVSLQEVFVQVPAMPGTPYLLPVTGADDGVVRVDAAVLGAYGSARAAFGADRGEQQAHAAATVGAAQRRFRAAADRDELAAAQLREGCACTYAAVAVGTVGQLAALRTSDVSVIALAPAGVTADGITARPLLPSETAVLQPSAAPRALVAGSIP